MAKKKVRHTAESFEVLSDSSSFVYSEGMKALRTNIEFVAATDACKVIMITSAVSGEGKTSMSINLAVALAQNGKRVLVVDCDLRRPKIAELLLFSTEQPTSTVLSAMLKNSEFMLCSPARFLPTLPNFLLAITQQKCSKELETVSNISFSTHLPLQLFPMQQL